MSGGSMFVRAVLVVFALSASFAAMAAVVEIKTLPQYNKLFKSDKPLVVLYSSPTCQPCKQMKPHFQTLSNANKDVQFATINTHTKNAGLGKMLGERDITSVPTLIGSHKGKDLFEENGWGGKNMLVTQIKEFKAQVKGR